MHQVTEDELKDYKLWIKESDRIDELYKDLKPSEIRELVREFCEARVGSLSITDILRMGEESDYDHMFHIDLDDIDEKDKNYEVDIVLDYKHDQIYQEEMNNAS